MKLPSQCFHDNVRPPWQSYQNDSGKEWKAKAAAEAINGHLEWVYEYYYKNDPTRLMGAKNVGEFREKLCVRCTDIAVVKDFADAAKHRFLRRGNPNRTIYSSTAAVLETTDRLYFAPDGRDLLEIIRGVVRFWNNWPD